jgi:hemoglobin
MRSRPVALAPSAAALALVLLAGPLAGQGIPKPLYERIGGAPALRLVVDDFVATAAPDPKVNFTRNGQWKASDAAVLALKKHLVDFMAAAMGGPKNYAGRSMKEAHVGMHITQAEFDAIASHLKAALEKHKVAPSDVAEIMKIAGSTAPDIVDQR